MTPADANPRFLVVAPTYNNASTLMDVVHAIEAMGLPVLIVNDGSTDETATLLKGWAEPIRGRHVISYEANQGKAAALRRGFAEAQRLGFTHAATIDTDSQHDPADLHGLLALARENINAIVVGVRSISTDNYPAKSRVGRRVSNLLVRLLGGIRVDDSQCGLRVYPLAELAQLHTRAGRYAFETEVLIRAGWANMKVVQVPIRCIYFDGNRRVSHFKPWRDSISASLMHMKLIARSLLPWRANKLRPVTAEDATGTIFERVLRWMNPIPTIRAARRDATARESFARSLGTGLFFAFLPPLGFKTVTCLAVSRLAKLQPTIVLAASSLQTPPVGIALAVVALNAGHLLLTGSLLAPGEFNVGAGGLPRLIGFALACWALGGVVSGTIAGAIAYLVTRGRRRGASDATTAAAMSAAPSPPGTM